MSYLCSAVPQFRPRKKDKNMDRFHLSFYLLFSTHQCWKVQKIKRRFWVPSFIIFKRREESITTLLFSPIITLRWLIITSLNHRMDPEERDCLIMNSTKNDICHSWHVIYGPKIKNTNLLSLYPCHTPHLPPTEQYGPHQCVCGTTLSLHQLQLLITLNS